MGTWIVVRYSDHVRIANSSHDHLSSSKAVHQEGVSDVKSRLPSSNLPI
jgi:hypothetical protein